MTINSNSNTSLIIKYGISSSPEMKDMKVYAEIIDGSVWKELDYITYEESEVLTNLLTNSIYNNLNVYTDSEYIYIKNSANSFTEIHTIGQKKDTRCNRMRIWWPVEKCGVYIKKLNKYHVFVYAYDNDDIMYAFKSDVVNMMDNLAAPPTRRFDTLYQEYTEVYIPEDVMNKVSSIYITITPLEPNDQTKAYSSCQPGSSFISGKQKDTILLHQEIIPGSITYHIGSNIDSFDVLYDVLCSAYGLNDCSIYLQAMVMDMYNQEIVSSYLTRVSNDNTYTADGELVCDINVSKVFDNPEVYPEMDGLEIIASLDVYAGEVTEKDIQENDWNTLSISFMSNKIPLTEEIYKYIYIPDDDVLSIKDSILKKIEDMNQPITIPNIIKTSTITVNQTSSGSGVIKPVFVRAYPLDAVVLHRDVKENILINLDTYLGKTDTFYLKICGVFIPEYSRLYDGVVFNVNGSILTTSEGTYYICDEDKNLITTGKYTVE